MFSDVKGWSYTPLSTGRRWGCGQVTLTHERNKASWSLTVYGRDVVRQVGPRGGPGPLHEQVTIRAPVAGHQVVKLSRAGPWRGRRESEQAPFFQVFVGHCRGEEGGGLDHFSHVWSSSLLIIGTLSTGTENSTHVTV